MKKNIIGVKYDLVILYILQECYKMDIWYNQKVLIKLFFIIEIFYLFLQKIYEFYIFLSDLLVNY